MLAVPVAPAPEPEGPAEPEGRGPPEYRKSRSVVTYREGVLFRALILAVAGRYQVLAKVRLADFIWLANEPAEAKFHRNQILCKHVDFLICDRVTLAPLLAVELDDSSHQQPDHQARDQFKDDLFQMVDLPLLRLPIQPGYRSAELRAIIDGKINPQEAVSTPSE
jgi:hypothetical protein